MAWSQQDYIETVLKPEVVAKFAGSLLSELELVIDRNRDARFSRWRSLVLTGANKACRSIAESTEEYLLREGSP